MRRRKWFNVGFRQAGRRQQLADQASDTTIDTMQEALRRATGRYRTDERLAKSGRHIPAREAQFPTNAGVGAARACAEAYRSKGIDKLYSHQSAAAGDSRRPARRFRGHGLPTASGKTLCSLTCLY